MPTLIVIADPLTCERTTHPLRDGQTLADALMDLWPDGIVGSWRVYRETIAEENELAAVDLPFHVTLQGETYLLVLDLAGSVAWIAFMDAMPYTMAAIGLSLAAMALSPKPPRIRPDVPETLSANNLIAGQGNALRPGARVPEMLGRVRAYPDLLCPPVDVYYETNQTIGQMFVLGAGAYDVTDKKLGDTPLESIRGADCKPYLPGEEVPAFWVMKTSREVGDISLLGDLGDSVDVAGDTDFNAATHHMVTQVPVTAGVGRPIRIAGSFFNNGVRWVTAAPPLEQVTPPFIYTLEGPVVDEIGAEVSVTEIPAAIQFTTNIYYGNGSPFEFPDEAGDDSLDPQQVQFGYGWPGADRVPTVGDWIELRILATGQYWRGQIHRTEYPLGGRAAFWGIMMTDLAGHPQSFPSLTKKNSTYTSWREPETDEEGGGGGPPDSGLTNAPTNWYAVPMQDPQEIWVDIAFPQGLAKYDHGSKRVLYVQVRAEFRRAGATEAQDFKEFDFPYGTSTPLRFTKAIPVSTLTTLPAGSPTIEVRLVRVTPYYADSTNNQYIQDTRFARLAGVRKLVGQQYETATILAFTMSNTRSAGAVGDLQLNVIATRILPTWTSGGGWTALPGAPTQKWADNFVARAKAHDGGFRTDAQLDLVGIYALQELLDTMDPDPDPDSPLGLQGKISMTLDSMQDVDAELASIADVVRAVVYRVGRKLYVARDQANPLRLALFNARAKHPSGETVTMRMTGDSDNDCVIVKWVDKFSSWKQREYQHPPDIVPQNPLRVAVMCANWPQAWRRAVFEWNRLQFRRQSLTCDVTEDGRMVRVGDVVNVTDDVANLATCAGELVRVSGNLLTLDRDLTPIETGDAFTILLRDLQGLQLDTVVCTPVAGHLDQVQLARAPTVELKGRDASRGNLYAMYRNGAATVNPWLVITTAAGGPYVKLAAVNYSDLVYTGDTAPVPLRPILEINP